MMRNLLAIIALLISQQSAAAFSTMVVGDCKAAWEKAMSGLASKVTHKVSDDGWCQVIDNNEVAIDKVEWRAANLDRLLQHSLAPTALEIRITDTDILQVFGEGGKKNAPAMPMQIVISLHENADKHQVILDRLEFIGPKDNRVLLKGVFHDVNLSSMATMQVSMGSAKLRDITLTATGNRMLRPYIEPYIGDTFPERSRWRSAAMGKVMDWPDNSFPAATKDAVKKLIAVLPSPNGILDATVDTGAGISSVIFIQSFIFGKSSEDLLDGILKNTVFHAKWTSH